MDEDYFYTVAEPVTTQWREKRSLFIGQLFPVRIPEEAEHLLQQVRQEFHDATHHCFAYRIAPDQFRASDDGEPSGTAGRPILAALEAHHLLQVLLVVTRYFGGVKLGTGGLKRAYAQTAQLTIARAKKIPFQFVQRISLQYAYPLSRQVSYLIQQHAGQVVEAHYGEAVHMLVDIPVEKADRFLQALQQLAPEQVQIRKLDTSWKSVSRV